MAKQLSVSTWTIYKLRRLGLLRALPGMRGRYSASEVERYLSAGQETASV